MPFDGDPVAVVDPAKVAQHLVTGERGRFARYALHHVAVAAYGINVVVEHREVRPIEMLRQPAPGERHADAVAAALAQRAGRRLDAGGQVIFGMAGASAADLPKPLDIVERDRGLIETLVFGIDGLHAAEMQQRVEQHRGMAIGKDEAIAVGPDRVIRIEAQKILPERVGHRRQRHRRAGMAGIGLLDGVHRQGANCVNALLVDRACRCRTLPAFAELAGSGVLGSGDREDVTAFFFERMELSERTPSVIIRLHHCKLPANASAGPKTSLEKRAVAQICVVQDEMCRGLIRINDVPP